MGRLIDLTLTLWPGMRGVEMETTRALETDGWNARTLHLYSHCGTHMDAPPHFGVEGPTIDEIALDRCTAPSWLLDLNGIAPRALIGLDDLGDLPHKIVEGDGLLIRTGWSRFVNEPKWRDELPRVSLDLAKWCVERGIRLLGVEPPSVADVHNREELTAVHRTLLEGNVVIVEGLTNLDAIRQEKVTFMALPLKVGGGDGAPVRALAIED